MRSNNRKRIRLVDKGEEDRLSGLPDDLLIHILSFLPDVTYAAQTCVLSKRWNTNFWIHHPDVYLNSKTFGKTSYRFIKFVDMVLSERNKLGYNVRSFTFVWTFLSRVPQNLFDRVHVYAQSRDVRHFNLSIDCAFGVPINLPSQKFCPESLTTLRLNLFNGHGGCSCLDFTTNLRDLYLSGCTGLKTLWLENFYIRLKIGDVDVDHFSSLVNLTELGIVNCDITGPVSNQGRFCIPVRAPRLERLIVLNNFRTPWRSYDALHRQPRYVEDMEIDFQSHKDYRASYLARRSINIFRYPPRTKSFTVSESTLQWMFCRDRPSHWRLFVMYPRRTKR